MKNATDRGLFPLEVRDLTVRYGDWKIPVKEWNHNIDDKAIHSFPMEDLKQ